MGFLAWTVLGVILGIAAQHYGYTVASGLFYAGAIIVFFIWLVLTVKGNFPKGDPK